MRQVVIDTETTGLEVSQGHRIIEIGAVEIVNRVVTGQEFHCYLKPDREIDSGALEVHGITLEDLQDKPRFSEIVDDFLAFVKDSELIIHNAPFDTEFLNAELATTQYEDKEIKDFCNIFDTLPFARKLHPGQRNSLDALCKRYEIDNSHRELHGALLDAKILADVYLAMTGGQVSLVLSMDENTNQAGAAGKRRAKVKRPQTTIVYANQKELAEHDKMLKLIREQSNDQQCLWLESEELAAVKN